MIFRWIWGEGGFLCPQETETKSTVAPKKKGKALNEKSKKRKKR